MTTKDIVASLDRVLKPLGFIRKKATWNRATGTFVDVLDIQVSKAGDTVTVNVGVLERNVYIKCWGWESSEFVEEPNCTVRARIGELINQKDKWWQVSDSAAVEDIVSHVVNFALPFFEKLHSLERMSEWLTRTNVVAQKYPPPVIYLAILQHRLGDQNGACALLGGLLAKTADAWKVRVGEVAERLGCP